MCESSKRGHACNRSLRIAILAERYRPLAGRLHITGVAIHTLGRRILTSWRNVIVYLLSNLSETQRKRRHSVAPRPWPRQYSDEHIRINRAPRNYDSRDHHNSQPNTPQRRVNVVFSGTKWSTKNWLLSEIDGCGRECTTFGTLLNSRVSAFSLELRFQHE